MKRTWSLYAPVYGRAMRRDERAYSSMYEHISELAADKDLLEVATGSGLLTKHIAKAARTVTATDYAEGMVREARKVDNPANLAFEIADATALPYADVSFDVIVIASALHVMDDPDGALAEKGCTPRSCRSSRATPR
uniref:class I SAM-dependent methyltransferase n=1 Tax=Olsenella uli TaxID=133926 RepID=UPI0028E8A72A|nr:class I SAM-dependent methyltransferase [Olsenella uli]